MISGHQETYSRRSLDPTSEWFTIKQLPPRRIKTFYMEPDPNRVEKNVVRRRTARPKLR